MIKIRTYIIACAIPFITIVFSLFVMHGASEESQFVQFTRASIMYAIILFFIFRKTNINIASFSILLFLGYYIALIVFREFPNGETLSSIRLVSRISISMLLFLVGFSFINTEERLHKLNIYTILTGMTVVLYILVVNVFGIGRTMYYIHDDMDEESGLIRTGMFSGVSMNTISYILLLAPLIIYTFKRNFKSNHLNTLLFVTLFIILLLVLRRSAIIIVLLGYFIYIFKMDDLGKTFRRNALVGVALLILLFPFYSSMLISMYEVRGDHAISTQAFDQDTRAREIPYMVADILNTRDISYQLFGKSFRTTGAFPLASAERSLHSDITNLLYMSGIIGFLLYLFIHIAITIFGFKYRKYAPKVYFTTLFVLVMVSIFLMYPGRFTALTYRSIMYIYLGSITGTMYLNYLKSINVHKRKKKYSYNY